MAGVNGEGELHYDVELDYTEWLPVPLGFPWNGFADAREWSTSVASSILDGSGAPAEGIAALATTALTIATTEGPFPGAMERFWFVGGPDDHVGVAHLYIAEYPDTGEAAVRAVATAGIGGYVQVLEPVEDSALVDASRAVIVAEREAEGEGPVLAARFIGFAGGLVFIAEAVHDEPTMIALMIDPLEELFRGIRVGGPGVDRPDR